MHADEFIPAPAEGRVVTITRTVGLGDVRPDGRARLDALARYVQDVADADAATAPLDGDGVWVLRRIALRIDRLPRLRAEVTLRTWCSGFGACWAERRTDLTVGAAPVVQAVALWVYTDFERGSPKRLPAAFDAVWGTAAGGRKVRANLRHPPRPVDGHRAQPWPLRAVDIDVLGHVNNAAYWAPIEEELTRREMPRVTRAEFEFRAGLAHGEPVICTIADRSDGFAAWLTVHGDVRASALVECASS
jgi:acyl-ACP thioesterase